MRALIKACDIKYLQIQEQFLWTKSPDSFVSAEFPDYNCYLVPGDRSAGQESGRAKGGLDTIVYL